MQRKLDSDARSSPPSGVSWHLLTIYIYKWKDSKDGKLLRNFYDSNDTPIPIKVYLKIEKPTRTCVTFFEVWLNIRRERGRRERIQILGRRKVYWKEWGHRFRRRTLVPKGWDGPLIRRRELEGDTSRFRSSNSPRLDRELPSDWSCVDVASGRLGS